MEEKLFKRNVVRKSDWKKIGNLFFGWGCSGDGDDLYLEEKRRIAVILSECKLKYLRGKVESLKHEVDSSSEKVERVFQKGPNFLFSEVKHIKFCVVRDQWQDEKFKMEKKLEWVVKRGGVRLKCSYFQDDCDDKSDRYLVQKYGVADSLPIVYGGVDVNENEAGALLLPPKFALHEMVDYKDVELEARKAGVIMRWHLRSKEENEGQSVNMEKWEVD